MNHLRRIAIALAGLTTAALAFAAASPAAFATRVPPPGGPAGPVPAAPAFHTIASGGMPGWQITLIAAGAALLAAILAVALDRAWAARRHTAIPSA